MLNPPKNNNILGALFGNAQLPEVQLNIELSTKAIIDLCVAAVITTLVIMVVYNKFFK